MGIRALNKYIRDNTRNTDAIISSHLQYFSGKTIVIDTSIYIYKFIKDAILKSNEINCLLSKDFQNNILNNYFEKLIALFKKYSIVPIFIFDGSVPEEKRQIIVERQQKKQYNKGNFYKLLDSYTDYSLITKKDFAKLKDYRIKQIFISDANIKTIQSYFIENKIKYLKADQESDEICYKYTKNNTAELCLSEDTDIIVYGCQYMLWNLNIDTGACDLYDLKNILTALNVTLDDLQQISALTMLESKKISNIYYIFNNHYYYKLDQKTQKNTGQTPNNFIWWFCKIHNINNSYYDTYNNYLKFKNITKMLS
tara:strand:+ start:368 stop:1300 length:933 start_codon:yes stop_codon:yes gene_type:complete